jgi:hypothetical protein
MPQQCSGDKTETILGRWLQAQHSKLGKGRLEPRQREALDAVGAWDSDRRKRREGSKLPTQLSCSCLPVPPRKSQP